MSYQRFVLKFIILASMLLGLPLLGVLLAGYPIAPYLEFPPQTRYVEHAPFSCTAFIVITIIVLSGILLFAVKGVQSYRQTSFPSATSRPSRFPWWGWVGAIAGTIAWILAWTRFDWFEAYQAHTFSPLWFSYILMINAICWRRTGQCLMTDHPGYFLLLFPLSAVFWWFFEFLNRFVQNWYYVGPQFDPWAYFWYATLPFSTVLPAVLSTRQYLLSVRWIRGCCSQTALVNVAFPRIIAAGLLLTSAVCLAGIGVWPNYLFPFLWVSPLIIIVCLQALMKEDHVFMQIAAGDWRGSIAAVLAAIICGFFWEMWNYYSLAKWEYSIPLVHRFQIFEMPLLGYSGYLPFGLECIAVGSMMEELLERESGRQR